MPDRTQIERLTNVALLLNDGHLTIFRFTTGWKAMAGTPDLDTGAGRAQVEALPAFDTFQEAVEWAADAAPIRHA